MKLKSKILVITSIISAMILILVGVMFLSFLQYKRSLDTIMRLSEVTNNFVKNLNAKNNFFQTKDIKYLSNTKTLYNEVIKNITYLADNEKDPTLKKQYLLLQKQFQTSSKLTKNYIEYEKKMGLTEEEGIRKNLRDAIHRVEHTINNLHNYKLLSEMLMLRRREKDFIIRKKDKYLTLWQKDYEKIQQDVKATPMDKDTKDQIMKELKEYKTEFATFTTAVKNIENFRENLNKLVNSRTELLDKIETATENNLQDFQKIMILVLASFSIAIIIITSLLLYLSIKALLKPIYRIREFTKYLSNGDFRYNLDIESRDELGQLANDINQIVLNLRHLIGDIVRSVKLLNSVSESLRVNVDSTLHSSRDIKENADKTKNLVEDQAASVTETSAAVEEMTRNIDSLNSAIENQTTSINQSSSAIEEMVSSINSVTTNTENASVTVEKLKEVSNTGRIKIDKMNEIILNIAKQSENLIETNKIIANISSQTNLLAMNAAIEAAHAGESGKGFAVVADEIRNLAEQSAVQSKEIEKNLKGIKELIDAVVTSSNETQKYFGVMEEHVDIVQRVIDEIRQSMMEQKEGSTQILEALKTINDITATVNTGSKEMKVGSEQILESIINLNKITQDTKENINEILDSISEINQAMDNIGDLTNQNLEFTRDVTNSIEVFKIDTTETTEGINFQNKRMNSPQEKNPKTEIENKENLEIQEENS